MNDREYTLNEVIAFFESLLEGDESIVTFEQDLVHYIRILYEAFLINSYEMLETCNALDIQYENSEKSFMEIMLEFYVEEKSKVIEMQKSLDNLVILNRDIDDKNSQEMLALDNYTLREELDIMETEYDDLAERYERALALLEENGISDDDLFYIDSIECDCECDCDKPDYPMN